MTHPTTPMHGSERFTPSPLRPIETLPEYGLLTGPDVAATPDGSIGDPLVELKRTEMSRVCFAEALQGDMHRFARLTDEQQTHLHREVAGIVTDQHIFDAVDFLLLTHDSFKKHSLHAAAGFGPEVDHDEAYGRFMSDPQFAGLRERYMPTFSTLSERSQRLIVKVAQVSFNYPQALQGEAPAATLESIHNESDYLVRDVDILLKKFDIFGAAGHLNTEVSLSATPATYRRMQNLDRALRCEPRPATAEDRYSMFLDAEITDFLGPDALRGKSEEDLTMLRVIARLSCHLRIDSSEAFVGLMQDFEVQPPVVQAVLFAELSREERATLASYSPTLVRVLKAAYGSAFALTFLAHVLQEVHIADRKARQAGLTGIVTAQLDDLVRRLQLSESDPDKFDPAKTVIRFAPHGNALVAEPQQPSLETLDGIPEFSDHERLRGKRIVVVAEGGGSDGVQAAIFGLLMARRYGAEVAAVVSVRNEERQVRNTGRSIGRATKQITPATEPVGEWRFLENVPLEGDNPCPMYLLSSTDKDVIRGDIEAMIEATGAEVIIGLDTGGDSLYRTLHATFSAHLPSEITPDQDYTVIEGVAELAGRRPTVDVLSVIPAPGVDSPPYAREVINEIGASQLTLTPEEASFILRLFAAWRMDGSASEQGRYGKTPFAWQYALRGEFGLRSLPLPVANATTTGNTWRAFMTVTPAMAGILIMDMKRHFAAIDRGRG